MTAPDPRFYNFTTSTYYTGETLSASGNRGRQRYMDSYDGSTNSVTIANDANQVAGFSWGDFVLLYFSGSLTIAAGYVEQITLNDYPGNTGLSTATITFGSALKKLGRSYVPGFALSAGTCSSQLAALNTAGYISTYVTAVGVTDGAAAQTFTGTVAQFLNDVNNTTRGILVDTFSTVDVELMDFTIHPTYAWTRTKSADTVAYSEITRTKVGVDFTNTVTVTTPTGLSATASNAASVSQYWYAGTTAASLAADATQAAGIASWAAYVQSDPDAEVLELTFSMRAQEATATAIDNVLKLSQPVKNVTYKPQGQAEVTEPFLLEGFNYSLTAEEMTVTAYLSPFTYYREFRLNSSSMGVLDQSRLGW